MDSPDNFLGLDSPYSSRARSKVWVLPVPLEATVSYGAGTAAGPGAIIAASQQLELYDREFFGEPATEYGVFTLPPLRLAEPLKETLEAIGEAVEEVIRNDKFPVVLGGEHTVTIGGVRGILQAGLQPLTIVQIDAHCDLRDSYQQSRYSHACVARRLLEEPGVESIVQLGIRSLCREEAEFVAANQARVTVLGSEEIHRGNWREELIGRIAGKKAFVTIDVDGLDPSIVPATGTPEPDGLTWSETLEILRTVSNHAGIAGIDCVELAPAVNLHMADFAVAKLVYKAISYALKGGA